MKKKLLYSGLAVISSLTAFGLYFTERVIHIKKKPEKEIIDRDTQLKHIDPISFNQLQKTERWIPSPHGYQISALEIHPHDNKRYVVFSHGVTESKMSSIKYANLFLKRGFNAIIYDQRRHGQTGGKTTSYGYYEKDDLKAVVDWLSSQYGDELLLGIHGESMGAATTLLYAGEEESKANFYVVDCPFSDLKELLTYRMKEEIKWLPANFFIPIGNVFLKLREGFTMDKVSPKSIINKIEKPVLFIHSEKDDYILPSMTEELYEKKPGDKMIFIAKNGEHAQSLNKNRTDYEDALNKFLSQYVLGKDLG